MIFYTLWHRNDSGMTARPTTPLTLFEEYFNDNNLQWNESSSDERRFAVTDGHYIIDSKVEGSWWYTTLPIAINQSGDFKIECTAKVSMGLTILHMD